MSYLDLAKGETVDGFQAGTETMGLTVHTPRGDVVLRESEIFARPRAMGKMMRQTATERLYRAKSRGGWLYRAVMPQDERKPVVILSGPAFDGGAGDWRFVDRLHLGESEPHLCIHRFDYGWDVILNSMEAK